jgi:hypothetical protein
VRPPQPLAHLVVREGEGQLERQPPLERRVDGAAEVGGQDGDAIERIQPLQQVVCKYEWRSSCTTGTFRRAGLSFATSANPTGAGMGALGAGAIRTRLETYTPAWVTVGAICILAAGLVLRIGLGERPYLVTPSSQSTNAS